MLNYGVINLIAECKRTVYSNSGGLQIPQIANPQISGFLDLRTFRKCGALLIHLFCDSSPQVHTFSPHKYTVEYYDLIQICR